MDCNEFRKFIHPYLDKELPGPVEKEWHEHHEDCKACRNEVQLFKKCIGMLQHFMGEELPPTALRERLKQRLGRDCFEYCFPARPQKKDDNGGPK